MKGADQCPKCASRKWVDVDAPSPDGLYSRIVRVCKNCKTLWESFDPAALFDPNEPLAAFTHPCNNCAFRKGSYEQKDKEEWAKTVAALEAGAHFYCHKGVPIDVQNPNGYAYPKDGKQPLKLRACRGYLNAIFSKKYRAFVEASA